MTTLVAVGAQWGDEGKGKLVDWLAPKAQLVVRFHGGNNAGHTLVVDGEQTILHIVPSGILHPGTTNLIGPGVVVDPTALLEELEVLSQRGILRDPDYAGYHIVLAAAYAQTGRAAEAAREAETVRRLDPFFEAAAFGSAFSNPQDRSQLVDGLVKAGLK